MVQSYKSVGLGMVDLTAFIKSMKTGWIKRLYWSKQDWTLLTEAALSPIDILVTYGGKKLRKVTKTIENPFWRDVMKAWTEFIELRRLEIDEVLSEKIWCSDHTKYKYETVKYWDEKGFRFINDMVNPATGFLFTREQINRLYDIKMTFLCYHTLVTSLPPKIRKGNVLKKLEQPIIPSKLTLMANNVALTRVAYQGYVESLKGQYKKSHQIWMSKWTRDVGTVYEGSMVDIQAATNNTYLLSFHFRIISRIIATNKFLSLIGKSETSLCTFCAAETETIRHLFWSYRTVRDFVRRLEIQIYERLGVSAEFEEGTWFFPNLEEKCKLQILMITLVKLVIYKARSKNERPNVNHFFRLLRMEGEKELASARYRDKDDVFNEKWGSARSILDSER